MRLGIIGTGRIANRFVEASGLVNDVEIVAVYNPHAGSAAELVANNNISAIPCDSFDDFIQLADAVYIATPHNTHYEYILSCLNAGKHVLCEKPITLSSEQTEEVYNLAKSKRLVLMEAIKTAYSEGFNKIIEVINSGCIGKVHDVEACFTKLTPTHLREFQDIESGGSLSELGSYVMLPIFRILGCDYKAVSFQSVLAPNGVDAYTKVIFTYDNACALAKTGLGVKSEGQLLISGTKGYILAESPWWLTKHFQVRYENSNKIDEYYTEFQGSGLQYELQTFADAIKGNNTSVGVNEDESMAISSVMEHYLKKYSSSRIDITKQDKDSIKIWAHRGCSYVYPENTLEAFETAAKLNGITGVELDVQLSSDEQMVVFHDETVDRVTNGSGFVKDFTLEKLKALKVAPGMPRESTIPTLEEVLILLKPYCIEKGLLINIELKTSVVRYEGIEQKVYDLVKQYGLNDYVVYSSFLPDSVAVMKSIDSSVSTGMLAGNVSDAMDMGERVLADALHPYIGGLDESLRKVWKGKIVRVWTGDEPFYTSGKALNFKDFRNVISDDVTDLITNVPEMYLDRSKVLLL